MLALKFVLLTLLMILGVAAALVAVLAPIGGMWPVLLAAGIAVACFAIWRIVRVNQQHIAQAKAHALSDPELLYARWTDEEGRDVVFAASGLFIGRAYRAFFEGYSLLEKITLDGDTLRVTLLQSGGQVSSHKDVRIEVPAKQRDAVHRGVEILQKCIASSDEDGA